MSKMKKISCIVTVVIAICMIFILSINVSAAESPEIAGGNFTACRGEQITMSVTLTDNPGFTYLKLGVDYDENALTLVSVSNGNICSNLTKGTYYIWSADENVTSDGILITLVFRVKDDAVLENTEVTIECVECSDYDENDVSVNVVGGSVDIICAHGAHPEMFDAVVTAPTCTAMGYTTYTCDCGDSYIADYIDAAGHTHTSVVTAPTCTAMGYTTYTCICGDSYVADYTDAVGHTPVPTVTAPTCTTMGYTTYACDCGISFVSDYTEMIDHAHAPVVTAPTCTAMGYTTYTCICGDSYVADYTDAEGHSSVPTVTAPTCTAMGYTTYVCSCGDTYITKYIDPMGHNFGEWMTEKEATETEEGLSVRHCTHNCDVTESRSIPVVESKKAPVLEIAVITTAVGVLLLFAGMVCYINVLKKKFKEKKD